MFSLPYRYVWPAELDLMARIAGMRLRERWSGWSREPFTGESASHVSVWEKCRPNEAGRRCQVPPPAQRAAGEVAGRAEASVTSAATTTTAATRPRCHSARNATLCTFMEPFRRPLAGAAGLVSTVRDRSAISWVLRLIRAVLASALRMTIRMRRGPALCSSY